MTNYSTTIADLDTVLRWIVSVLDARQAQQIAPWRMLEYWLQVELFRSLASGGFPDFQPAKARKGKPIRLNS